MPKLKASEFKFDEEELEEAEWSEEDDYGSYEGEQPPAQMLLNGFIKRAWITESNAGNDMLVLLFEARENVGDKEQYNGWSTFDRLVFQTNTKFRWQPFLNATGLSIRDIKNKMYVEDGEPGRNGLSIQKIGTWVPGDEDNALAWTCIITKREFYNDEWQAKVAKWLTWKDPEEDDADDADDEPPARPTARSSTSSAAKSGAKASTSSARRRAVEPDDDDGGGDDSDPDETPPARRATRTAAKPAATRSRTAAKPAAASKPAARGRGRGAAAQDDPPF